MPPRGRGHANKNGNKRPNQTREVTISKQLGYLLRHGAADEGITLDEGGWANVADVLAWRRMSSLKATFPELQNIVEQNDKQRYQMMFNSNPDLLPEPEVTSPSTHASRYLIRALQGHSISTVSADKLLTPITASDPDCPMLVVHGTYQSAWHEIQKSGGLKPMSRNHIHFATKEPDKLPPREQGGSVVKVEVKTDVGKEKVLSGMRAGATILIWVDVRRSMQGGVKWWRSQNGVFLTDGAERVVGGEKERVLGFEWIRWVERRGMGDVLWKSEGVDIEAEKLANRMAKATVEGETSVNGGNDGSQKVDGRD